jgi:hypothetical protein
MSSNRALLSWSLPRYSGRSLRERVIPRLKKFQLEQHETQAFLDSRRHRYCNVLSAGEMPLYDCSTTEKDQDYASRIGPYLL